jgi:geranylgeranyl diphosphate synthase, type II
LSMELLVRYRELLESRIAQWVDGLPATSLYAPMAYIMRLPAKRIRPTATLMACELFGTPATQALEPALGLELFHNFTLMHDDIMDQAPLRRGQETVHMKWDVNTAILSGDAMLVKAYELIGTRPDVLQLFNAHALAVCEGQQSDMEFEKRDDVTLAEYMEMIRRKTALLLACAMRTGAIIGGASEEDARQMGLFGEHLGLAFQLRDDLLDAFGDPGKVGKQPGGDLRAGKKTWLLIRGLELEAKEGSAVLRDQLQQTPEKRNIQVMLSTLERLGARHDAEAEVARHERGAIQAMESIGVVEERKEPLLQLAGLLMSRTY